jgi:hypothetical protein
VVRVSKEAGEPTGSLRERRWAAFDEADAELRWLIREGFEEGISGEKLARRPGYHCRASTRSAAGDVEVGAATTIWPQPPLS